MKKFLRICIIFIIIISIVFITGVIYKISPLLGSNGRIIMPKLNYAETFLKDNYENLYDASLYIMQEDGKYVRWDASDDNILISDGQEKKLNDLDLQNNINQLKYAGI